MKNVHYILCAAMIAISCSACANDKVVVRFNGNEAEVESSDAHIEVACKGSHVLIVDTLGNAPISVRLEGQSDDGTFELKTRNEATITLAGLRLTSKEGAPFVLKNKQMATIIAENGTENTLTIEACVDTATHKSACLWAKKTLNLTGKGMLSIFATGDGCKGVRVKKDLNVSDIDLLVSTTGMYLSEDTTHNFGPPEMPPTMGDGAHPFGGEGFNLDDMPEEIKAHVEEMRKHFEEMMQNGEGMPPFGGGPMGGMPMMGEYIGTAKGVKVGGTITINSGKVRVTTSTPGAEGMEGKKGIVINGGDVYVKAWDDALNANGTIEFNGGHTVAWSTNNDAIDANIDGGFPMFGPPMFGQQQQDKPTDIAPGFIINGGTVFAFSQIGPPEEGFDCDSAPFHVNGGTAFSIGAGMGDMPSVPSAETAKQPTVLLIGVQFKEGEQVRVSDAEGNELMSFSAPFDFTSSSSMITSPLFEVGKEYQVQCGDSLYPVNLTEQFTVIRHGTSTPFMHFQRWQQPRDTRN